MEHTFFLPGADPAGTSKKRLAAMRRECAGLVPQRLQPGDVVVAAARVDQLP